MKTKFWIEEKSPKLLFDALIKDKDTVISFWDIFSNYSPIYENIKPTKNDKGWILKQNIVIEKIIAENLYSKKLNRQEIALLLEAIQEFTFLEDEQNLEYLSTEFKEKAKLIATAYIIPLKMNTHILDAFLDNLENRLKKINKEYIIKCDIVVAKQNIRLQAIQNNYSKEKTEQMLHNLDLMWGNAPLEKEEDEEIKDESEIAVDTFFYPQINLAISTTFYGFNGDGGEIPYEEQEKISHEKFKQYQNEISKILGQNPNNELLPKLDFKKIETNSLWETYDTYTEANPFTYEFEGDFVAWKRNDKVLFLSVKKEDKELPYEINLGGLDYNKYREVVETYNNITS